VELKSALRILSSILTKSNDVPNSSSTCSLSFSKKEILPMDLEDSTVEGEGKREREVYRPPPPPKVRLQPNFQSGASPAGLSNGFRVYNGVGIIKSNDSDQENILDVEFHDIAVNHALHLSNSEGATMASLSRNVLTTATVGDDVVGGKLMVNYFSSGDVNKEWSVVLEEEEEIRGLAVGDKWVAMVEDAKKGGVCLEPAAWVPRWKAFRMDFNQIVDPAMKQLMGDRVEINRHKMNGGKHDLHRK
jgi:hypothetical protein